VPESDGQDNLGISTPWAEQGDVEMPFASTNSGYSSAVLVLISRVPA
jgi:hypothetical protein